MPRGRRKGRLSRRPTERPGSQDSCEGPREKETRLSSEETRLSSEETRLSSEVSRLSSEMSRPSSDQSGNIFVKYYRETVSLETCHTLPPQGSDMELASSTVDTAVPRDTCDSPTMPCLSPEVPSFGELPDLVGPPVLYAKDGPPVLTQYGEDDVCDQASEKSEGDSGKENEEDLGVLWRGSLSSLTSRSSRPRSAPFNQLNNTNIKANKPQEKKSVLGEANTIGPVTRSAHQSKPGSVSNLELTGAETRSSGSLSALDNLDTTKRTHESPVKGMAMPQSPMSPHKIQIPDRPSIADKLKHAISKSPKTFSTKNAKRSTFRKTEETKVSKKLGKLAAAAEGSRQITDYFPIRRSERKKKSEIEKDKMEGIEARLLATDDKDLDLAVRIIQYKGRGVVTTRAYEKGEFVLEYSGELIDIGSAKDRESMYSLDTTKGCYMYYFNHKEKQYCIDATQETGRYGRLVNHSCKTPNCVTKVVMLGDEPRLILVAKQDIEPDTELLYDYGDRSKESLKAHPWLLL